MRLRVVAVAEQEFAEAVDYYNQQRAGLGFEMAAEVAAAFERIREYPNARAPFSPTTRRCQVHRFPFGVLYHICDGEIVVIAIMHLPVTPSGGRIASVIPGSSCGLRSHREFCSPVLDSRKRV